MRQFGLFFISVFALLFGTVTQAASLNKQTLTLQIAGQRHHFDLYSPVGVKLLKRPAVVLVPEYWGKDKLVAEPAEALVNKGYIVLTVDLYGDGQNSKTTEGADKLVEDAEAKGFEQVVGVVARAVEFLKGHEGVDSARIAAIGLGYGGGLVYNLAKRGTSGLAVAVSFYGGTKKLRETSRVGRLPEFLYIRPELDNYTSDDEFSIFKNEISKSGFSYEILAVDKAYYGFIHKNIEMYGGDVGNTFMHFDQAAAGKAWEKTHQFLEQKLKAQAN